MGTSDRNKVGSIKSIALPSLLSSPSSTIPLSFFILHIQQLREREREIDRQSELEVWKGGRQRRNEEEEEEFVDFFGNSVSFERIT